MGLGQHLVDAPPARAAHRAVGERMAGSRVAPIGRRVAGTETGVLLGYLAQRVLGQYDLLVLDDDAAADAVYYVGGNILSLEKRFAFRRATSGSGSDPRGHPPGAVHRGPWMKPYYLSLVESTLSSIDPDPAAGARGTRRIKCIVVRKTVCGRRA